jgi:hypothetical protein
MRCDDSTGPGLGVGPHGPELEYLELFESEVTVRRRIATQKPTGAALPKENVARRIEIDRERDHRVE